MVAAGWGPRVRQLPERGTKPVHPQHYHTPVCCGYPKRGSIFAEWRGVVSPAVLVNWALRATPESGASAISGTLQKSCAWVRRSRPETNSCAWLQRARSETKKLCLAPAVSVRTKKLCLAPAGSVRN